MDHPSLAAFAVVVVLVLADRLHLHSVDFLYQRVEKSQTTLLGYIGHETL